MCSLVLLLFLIGGYNTVLAMREQRDEIARLTAELEGSKMTVSALKEQQAKTTENTAAEALKGADAKNTDGGWKDGTYEGEGQGFGGKVTTQTTGRSEHVCLQPVHLMKRAALIFQPEWRISVMLWTTIMARRNTDFV